MMAAIGAPSVRQAGLEFITVNGVRIAYADTGGTGAPLVLVHGSWGSHHNWDLVVQGLAGQFGSSPTTAGATATVSARRGRGTSRRMWPTSQP